MINKAVIFCVAMSVSMFNMVVADASSTKEGSVVLEKSQPAPEKKLSRWVTTTGVSRMNAGIDIARRAALLDAYRKAISGSNEIMAQGQNLKIISDILVNKKNSFVQHYNIVDGGVAGSEKQNYQINMKSYVVSSIPDEKERDINLSRFINMVGAPRVLLFLRNDDGDESSGLRSMLTMENIISNHLELVDYDVLTTKDLEKELGPNILENIISGDQQEIIQVGRKLGVDAVIIGYFGYESTVGVKAEGRQLLCCNIFSIKWKITIPGNGNELELNTMQSLVSSGGNERLEKNRGVIQLAKTAANELRAEVLNILLNQTYDVNLLVGNVGPGKDMKIKNILEQLEGVASVRIEENREIGTLYKLNIVYTGPRGAEIRDVLEREFKGLSTIEVKGSELVMSY